MNNPAPRSVFSALSSAPFVQASDLTGPSAVAPGAMDGFADSERLLRQAPFAGFNPNLVLELSPKGMIDCCNPATEALARQLNLEHAAQILPAQTAVIVRDSLATGRPHLGLETVVHGRIIAWFFFPVPANQVVHCYAGDITECSQAEAELRRREELLQRILSSSRDCIKTLDLQGRLLTMNESGRCLMEIDDLRPLLNQPWVDFWQGADQTTAMNALAKARAGGVGQFQGHCPTAKGTAKWWDVTITPILDLTGQPEYLLVVSRDMTERRRVEATLQEREAQLRLYAEHSPTAVAMFDRDMRYLVVSRRWMDDYRLGGQTIVGRSHYEVLPEMPERWIEIHRRCLTGAVEQCAEDPFPRGDGTTGWIRWEIRPWHHADGQIGGIIVFSEDITGRKLATQRIQDQLGELRRWQQVMLDREDRVQTLKSEVNALLSQLNLPPRYGVLIPTP